MLQLMQYNKLYIILHIYLIAVWTAVVTADHDTSINKYDRIHKYHESLKVFTTYYDSY